MASEIEVEITKPKLREVDSMEEAKVQEIIRSTKTAIVDTMVNTYPAAVNRPTQDTITLKVSANLGGGQCLIVLFDEHEEIVTVIGCDLEKQRFLPEQEKDQMYLDIIGVPSTTPSPLRTEKGRSGSSRV
jgi:hypothetical protein